MPLNLENQITEDKFDFVDFSQVGSSGSGISTRDFSIVNNAASNDSTVPVRVGSNLGFGAQLLDADHSVYVDIKAYQAGIAASAMSYDDTHATVNDVKSDGLAAVGSVQAFSEYVTFNPIFVYNLTVQSSEADQLAKPISFNYYKEDITINNVRKLTQTMSLINRPNGNDSNVNVFTTTQLKNLYLSSMNYLEFISMKGKSMDLNIEIGAIAVIGQMKMLF